MDLIKIKGSAITKINQIFFLLAVVSLVFSMYNYLMYRNIGVKYQKSTELYYEAMELKAAIKLCDTAMEDYLTRRERSYLAQHNESVKGIEDTLKTCQKLVDTPAVASFIQSISDAFYSYQVAANYGAFSYARNQYYEGSLSFQQSREIGTYIEEYCDEILNALLEKNRGYYLTLNKKQNQLFFMNLYAVILLAFAAYYSLYYVNDTFYRPLKELYHASLKIAEGKMVQVKEDWQDSMIQTQAAAFNQMSKSIVRMMEDIQKNADIKTKLLNEELKNEQYVHRLEQAEFLNLQLQTNPHFLFNTLNTVSRTIALGMNDEAVEMIDSMAALLRYNLHHLEESVSLYEELEVIKEYLHIQSFRFRDRIQVKMDYEAELAKGILVPRFSLQPFVENAIIHGLEPKTESGYVQIMVAEEEQRCRIRICDNGLGIPAEKLDALNHGQEIVSGKRKSVGIGNTMERLVFFTKDPECVKIESVPGEGTIVTICIPMKEKPCIN